MGLWASLINEGMLGRVHSVLKTWGVFSSCEHKITRQTQRSQCCPTPWSCAACVPSARWTKHHMHVLLSWLHNTGWIPGSSSWRFSASACVFVSFAARTKENKCFHFSVKKVLPCPALFNFSRITAAVKFTSIHTHDICWKAAQGIQSMVVNGAKWKWVSSHGATALTCSSMSARCVVAAEKQQILNCG